MSSAARRGGGVFALAIAGSSMFQETSQQRAQRIESILAAAGFRMLPADTPERIAESERLTVLRKNCRLDLKRVKLLAI